MMKLCLMPFWMLPSCSTPASMPSPKAWMTTATMNMSWTVGTMAALIVVGRDWLMLAAARRDLGSRLVPSSAGR